VEGFDLIIPWQYPFPFKRVQWFSGGIDGTLMMTYINESNQIAISNGFEINYDNADGSIGMLVPNVMVNCSIFAVKVIITDLAFEDSSVGVTVIPSKCKLTILASNDYILIGNSIHYFHEMYLGQSK